MKENMKHDTLNAAQAISGNAGSPRHAVRKVQFAVIPLLVAALFGMLFYGCNRRPSRRERVSDSVENKESKNETALQDLQDQIKSLQREVSAAKNKAPAGETNDNEVQNLKDEIKALRQKVSAVNYSNEQLRKSIVELSSYVESSNAVPANVDDVVITTDAGSLNASESGLAEPAIRSRTWLPSDYRLELENYEIGVLDWGGKESDELRRVYVLDAEGNKMSGEGPADKMIKQIIARAKAQKDVLKETRKQLTSLRLTLKELAAEYDKLPPQIRKQAYELEQKEKEIEELTDEKKKVETELDNLKKEVDDLKADIDDYKDKLTQAKDETDEMTAKYEEQKKKFEDLMTIVKNQTATPRAAAGPVAGGSQLTPDDKGKIVDVGPDFVTIKFTDSALDELIGSDRTGALPPHEMYVVRPVKGPDGKPTQKRIIVGKVRLRQWTPNSNFVLAHVLKPYAQEPLVIEKGDDVIAD